MTDVSARTRQRPQPWADGPLAHIELYGRVAIVAGTGEVELGGRAAQILALLVSRSGDPYPATALLDQLWPEAPGSGLNAVQRHVSAIRRKLRDAGLADLAGGLIAHRQGSYRLDTNLATNDLDLVERGPLPSDGDGAGLRDRPPPRWWLEPLPGFPWESFTTLRARLDLAAATTARAWIDGPGRSAQPVDLLEALDHLATRHPNDEVIWGALRTAHRVNGASGPGHPTAVPPSQDAVLPTGAARALAAVSEAAAAFIDGEPTAALAIVEETSDRLGQDLAMRARRWFSRLDPADGLPHLLLGHLLAYGASTGDDERIYVALDAHALSRSAADIGSLRHEVEAATTLDDRTRAQRVLVFWLLGQPLPVGLVDEVGALAGLPHPEVPIEVARFELAVALRRGDFDAAPSLIARADELMQARYPGLRPWYGDLARTALYYHRPTRHLVGHTSPGSRFLASPLDQSVASLSRVWHELAAGRVTAATPAAVRQLTGQLGVITATALEVAYYLALGRPHEAGEQLRPYRGRLASLPRDPSFHLLPVAAGRTALALGDDHLAAEVVQALEPWAGEYLGVWTCDLLIEPVDDLLASLR